MDKPTRSTQLSYSVDWKLVEGLYAGRGVLIIGGIGPASVAAVAFVRTGLVFYVWWGIISLIVLAGRLTVYGSFGRRPGGNCSADIWRSLVLAGTWANGALYGVGAAFSMLAADPSTQMLVMTLQVAFVIGSAARNSLYPRASIGSVLIAEIPLILALLSARDPYYAVYAAFSAASTVAALQLSRQLYAQTVDFLVTNEEKALLVTEVGRSNLALAAVNGRLELDILLRRAMEEKTAEAARHDELTGLANRTLFMERLENTLNRVHTGAQPLFGVLFLDFDRFKLINDTLGHEAGDELLRQIADRLRSELRAGDAVTSHDSGTMVSRFGGDEFLVLIDDLKAADDATRIAARLQKALTPAYQILGSEVHSSASIGIITSEQCQTNAEDVVRNADVAMYEAKRAGRACSVVFNDAMHSRLTRHAMIENALRRAIDTDELYLVYQPIVELATGLMVSVEALARWNHPTLGAITPSEFIPIAEESGLIIALGQWVQKEACAAMATWRQQDPLRAPQTVSVNVSRAELALGQRLLDQVQATLDRAGLPTQCLQLEVTEREVMTDPEAAHALLGEMRGRGIELAMDDFGTGTSSLGLLRNYPFDTIKIDRSFVQDVVGNRGGIAVMHAIVNLIENLGMASLAEGVEDPAQVAVLQSLGCRYAQGYLFSRPVRKEYLLNALGARAVATPGVSLLSRAG